GAAITEEPDGDSIHAEPFGGDAEADRDRNATPYDAVCANSSTLDRSDMHGATLASAVAGGLPQYFREHAFRLQPPGKHVVVTSVRRSDLIAWLQYGAHANRRPFFTDRQVHNTC